jgi:hypothetical protein
MLSDVWSSRAVAGTGAARSFSFVSTMAFPIAQIITNKLNDDSRTGAPKPMQKFCKKYFF